MYRSSWTTRLEPAIPGSGTRYADQSCADCGHAHTASVVATIDTGCAPRRRQHHSRTIGRALVGLWLGLLLSTPCLADPQADFERGRQAFARDDLMGAIDWLRRAARAERAGVVHDRGRVDEGLAHRPPDVRGWR